jgi:hypothetical protein
VRAGIVSSEAIVKGFLNSWIFSIADTVNNIKDHNVSETGSVSVVSRRKWEVVMYHRQIPPESRVTSVFGNDANTSETDNTSFVVRNGRRKNSGTFLY